MQYWSAPTIILYLLGSISSEPSWDVNFLLNIGRKDISFAPAIYVLYKRWIIYLP